MRLALLIATVALALSSCSSGGSGSNVSSSGQYKKCETPWHEKRYQAVLTGCDEYAKSNSPLANALIGNVYLYGLSTERNVDKALSYYRSALSSNSDNSDWLGSLGAALQLARIQRSPEGGNDNTSALRYYQMALEYSPEIYAPIVRAELGSFIGLDEKGLKDTKRAYPILKSSAESGAGNGMLLYGLFLALKLPNNTDLFKSSNYSSADEWKAQNYARSLWFIRRSISEYEALNRKGTLINSFAEAYLSLSDFGFTSEQHCIHMVKDNSTCGVNGARSALEFVSEKVRSSGQAKLAYEYLNKMETAQSDAPSQGRGTRLPSPSEAAAATKGTSANSMCAGLAVEFERYMNSRSAEAAKSGDMCPQFLATKDISNRAIKLYEQCPQMDPTGELLDYHLKTSQTAAKGAKDVCA